uniref:Uncharacterized protein n=1 Tax=Quercus lobata TaxID=97700 RepID=A0A7N2LH41_QUELO
MSSLKRKTKIKIDTLFLTPIPLQIADDSSHSRRPFAFPIPTPNRRRLFAFPATLRIPSNRLPFAFLRIGDPSPPFAPATASLRIGDLAPPFAESSHCVSTTTSFPLSLSTAPLRRSKSDSKISSFTPRNWQRRLRQECRNVESLGIQREEKSVQKAIRDAAKRNDMGVELEHPDHIIQCLSFNEGSTTSLKLRL